MEWVYLTLAIVFELSGTISMKISDGYKHLVPTILVIAFYVPAFVMLGWATKKIDVGIAYAIWAGVGTALMATVGIVYFREAVSVLKIVGLTLVVVGVVLLNLSGGH